MQKDSKITISFQNIPSETSETIVNLVKSLVERLPEEPSQSQTLSSYSIDIGPLTVIQDETIPAKNQGVFESETIQKAINLVPVFNEGFRPGVLSKETALAMGMSSPSDPPPYFSRLVSHSNQTWYNRIWNEKLKQEIPGINGKLPKGANKEAWVKAGAQVLAIDQ